MRSCEKYHREPSHGRWWCPVCEPLGLFVRQYTTCGFPSNDDLRETPLLRLVRARRARELQWIHNLSWGEGRSDAKLDG